MDRVLPSAGALRRGPNQDGVSPEAGWNTSWPKKGLPKLWTTNVGAGYAAVSVAAGRLYTMGSSGEGNQTDHVFCLDVDTGQVVWKHTYQRPERLHKQPTGRSPANCMPTVEAGVVYTYSGDAQLFSLRAATGEVVWSRDLMKEFGARHAQYDHNASPVHHGQLPRGPSAVTMDRPDAYRCFGFPRVNSRTFCDAARKWTHS